MGKLFRFLFIVLILLVLGLIGYAYLGDLSPQREDREIPITIEID